MTVDLSNDEALVLFELLYEYGSNDAARELKIHHAAERNALWALSAQLEKRLVAPFQPNYSESLTKARARIEQQGGSW
jgi:hypothetical protein